MKLEKAGITCSCGKEMVIYSGSPMCLVCNADFINRCEAGQKERDMDLTGQDQEAFDGE